MSTYLLIFIFALILILWICFVVYIWSLYIRRAHDLGHSGWFSLLMLIPLVNLGVLIYFFCAKGEEAVNAYGEVNVGQSFWRSVFGAAHTAPIKTPPPAASLPPASPAA